MQVTREHILKILQERGQATVEELGEELQLTSATIRHHLDTLRGEGLIEAPAIRRRTTPGRPQYIYTLTEAAAQHFPKNYAGLANMMFSEIKERMQPDEVEEVLRSIAGRIAGEFPPGQADEPFENKLDRVLDFLNEKGYMVHCAKNEGVYSMHVVNCPYRDVSHTHAQLCRMDMSLISQLLGVTPQRATEIVDGEGVCIYRFTAPAV